MIELEVAVAVLIALLLIIIFIIFKVRKRISNKTKSGINIKTTGSAKQSQEINPGVEPVLYVEPKSKLSGEPKVDEPVFNVEPQSEPSVELQCEEPVLDTVTSIAAQTNEMVFPQPEDKYKNLPQDSMLRRHYLTHLYAMVESLKFPRPTDSALSRHYDATIIAEMEQCLSDEAAMERLVCNYEEHKKTLVQQIQIPEAVPESLVEPIKAGINQEKLKLPEDSMLRRHYLTHLRAIVESRMPPRPTDSTLRRHYDLMIENEVENLIYSE
ncbi:MAG: hypothetical protein PHD43_07770 [Methylococcales bacterium]|nr:hypothetical protein [Methylococcales bacterium]